MRPTDWDSYYARPYRTASLTRKHTASVLIGLMRNNGGVHPSILEFGGANSCFIDQIIAQVEPARYDVIDNNRLGLELLKSRYMGDDRVSAIYGDVLSTSEPNAPYDIVFSVGLIEHFDPAGTAAAVAAHFRYLRPGGTAIITFPTPTWLYRIVRKLAEATHSWIFFDERPLRLAEFERAVANLGEIKSARILWPLILTQYCVVTRKLPISP